MSVHEAYVSVSIDGGPTLPGQLEINQDIIVEPVSGARKPDPSWEYVDQAGHYHAYTENGRLPTLDVKYEQVPCGGSCGDVCGGEGYTVDHHHCRICGEEVKPATLPDTDPVICPGLKHWTVTVESAQASSDEQILGPFLSAPAGQVSVRVDTSSHAARRRHFGVGIVANVNSRPGAITAEIIGTGELGSRPLITKSTRIGDRDDIVDWLTAQLDTDERATIGRTIAREIGVAPFPADPPGVLADIDAKQAIIKRHHYQRDPAYDRDDHIGWRCAQCDTEYPCPTLKMLTWAYAERPGFRQEWRTP